MTGLDAKVRATALVAYKAAVDHAVENGLPAPESIDLGPHSLRIWITQGVEQWTASIHVDAETVVPCMTAGREIVYIDGRLPLLGIKVQLRYSQTSPAASHLQAVGS